MTQKRDLLDEERRQSLIAYAAQLEFEVDRLRRRDMFLREEIRERLLESDRLCASKDPTAAAAALDSIAASSKEFRELLRDARDPPGYHPAFDQVVAIAVRPLAEHIFRWQQRLNHSPDAILRLDLQPDHLDWFPSRLRHILESLLSNALRYRNSEKGEVRVGLMLRRHAEGYELRVTDNGRGMPTGQAAGVLDMVYRAAPMRTVGLGVGLAVVKCMVEQCCGTIDVDSKEGQGTSITIVLPHYDVDDYVA